VGGQKGPRRTSRNVRFGADSVCKSRFGARRLCVWSLCDRWPILVSARPSDLRLASKVARGAEPDSGGGSVTSLARRLSSGALAASTNSSCAPRGPRRRSRPSAGYALGARTSSLCPYVSCRDRSKAAVRQGIGRHRRARS